MEDDKGILASLIDAGISIAIIVVVAYFLTKFSNRLIGRIVRRSTRPEFFKTKRDEKLREKTISGILKVISKVLIWTTATLLMLSELGVNLGPLLAGAGIAGFAIGFGAQSLVADIVNGIFILLENQYRVGDVVEFNQEVSGTVESFSLRTTVLRDIDGMQHHIPNSEIKLATNMTVDFAKVNLDIGVAYDTDIEQLEKIINEVGKELAEDPEWSEDISEAPKFVRVNEFADSAIIVKILGKTIPVKQWAVTGELRKRLKIAFDKNDIEIPYPQMVIHGTTDNPKRKKKPTKK